MAEYEKTPTGVRRPLRAVRRGQRQVVEMRRGSNGRALVVPTDPVRKAMDDSEYEAESQSLAQDLKQLYRAAEDGDIKRRRHWAKQVLAARAYYLEQGEDDLVENADDGLAEVMPPAWCRRNDVALSGDPKGTGRYKRDAKGRFTKAWDPNRSSGERRMRAYAAGAVPVPIVNDLMTARQVARDSHPNNAKRNAQGQLRGTWGGAALGTLAGGALAGAALKTGGAGEARLMQGLSRLRSPGSRAVQSARRAVGRPAVEGPKPESKLSIQLSKIPGGAQLKRPAVLGGAFLGQSTGGQIGSWGGMSTAIRRDNRSHQRENASKALTKTEEHRQSRRKRINAALSATTGVGGLTGLALMGAGKTNAALKLGVVNGAIAGGNSLYFARLQNKEAQRVTVPKRAPKLRRVSVVGPEMPKAIMGKAWTPPKPPLRLDKVVSGPTKQTLIQGRGRGSKEIRRQPRARADKAVPNRRLYDFPEDLYGETQFKAVPGDWMNDVLGRPSRYEKRVSKALPKYVRFRGGRARVLEYHGDGKMTVLGANDERFITHRNQVFKPKPRKVIEPPEFEQGELFKADGPLEVRGSKSEHKRLLAQYGDKGPLPKEVDRETRMRAYEARYVHHGGPKVDRYARRADVAEGVRNVGLAGATVGGAAYLAAMARGGKKPLSTRALKWKRRGDMAAVGSATVGGAAELYGSYARNRRSSYANTPGGVAASSLRRMRAYTPED